MMDRYQIIPKISPTAKMDETIVKPSHQDLEYGGPFLIKPYETDSVPQSIELHRRIN